MDPRRHRTEYPDASLLRVLLDLQNRVESAGDDPASRIASGLSLQALRALLYSRNSPGRWDEDDGDDGDDDELFPGDAEDSFDQPVTEPQPKGVELLKSGEFGQVATKANDPKHPGAQLKPSARPAAYGCPNRDVVKDLIPNTNGTTVAAYSANMYTAQFSDDSSFYYTCAQDFKLHIFDMTKPTRPFTFAGLGNQLKTTMPLRKEITGHPGRWTITDANLSPDNARMIYSSITPTVYMTSTSPEGSAEQVPIQFDSSSGYYGGFGIWSCRFSADGNEVVAGGDGKIFVYDLVADKQTVRINAHHDDINSCCWADTGSGNVLVSASDDSYLKVWDRRSLLSKKPSGVLMGHTEGITYVSAKGDGRYVISNGKDQTLRLWDLRQMRSSKDLERVERKHFGVPGGFDYRHTPYPRLRSRREHPLDCSVMTYKGHSVLRTLIRCHFSPVETTGNQYIYSGSADGRIHIWSLDGRVVQVLDRSKTLPASFSPSGPEPPEIRRPGLINCVRDVSWHSQEPVLMSAAWDTRFHGTTIARHEWKGLSKFQGRLEDWTERDRQERPECETRRRRSSRLMNLNRQRSQQSMPGAFEDDDDDSYEDEDD